MIHVLFSSSAAGTLRQLLRSRGQRDRVVDLTEDLSWGPVPRDDFAEREAWFSHHVGAWDWAAVHADKFLKRVQTDTDRLVWIAPQSAPELAGFCWYLDRCGGVGTRVLTLDHPLRTGGWRDEVPLGLELLNDDMMGELFDDGPRLPWDASRFPADRWRAGRGPIGEGLGGKH